MNTYTLYFDGCSKGNPGPSGAGAVIYDVLMKEIWSVAHFVGSNNTNNEAEYTGLLVGLRRAVEMGMTDLLVCGDSQLIIRQMKGEYKVKSASLRPMYLEAVELAKSIETIQYEHVYREFNKRADELSNLGLV
jgi:ribonuclease HI